jgi:hypothetical protein
MATRDERPDELVSVPRWVLNELIPMSLGAMAILRQVKTIHHPAAVSEEELAKGDRAIEVAYDALMKKPDRETP